MKIKLLTTSIVVISIFALTSYGQTSAFTYQGQLSDGATPANGTYEMEFSLWDTVSAGSQIGATVSNPMVSVAGGVFTVQLDFGTTAFPGANRWLEIAVRKASDPPGFTTLSPRQQITSSPYAVKTLSATSADGLSTACVGCVNDAKISDVSATKLTGTVALANGGTGATTAVTARTNLGLGSLATINPTGTANSTTFLRGDNTWSAFSGLGGSGTTNYIPKFTAASTIGNSLVQESGNNLSVNVAPSNLYQFYVNRTQLTATGDGQATLFGYRTRDSQNDGTNYGQAATNSAVKGYNFWGDVYTFGVAGYSYNDYTRTGGVLGAEQGGAYWGSLGYKNSASLTYGVYGSNAFASGGGLNAGDKQGVGGGFFGNFVGSVSRGDVFGTINSGSVFATYNVGNVFTSGYSADLVKLAPGFGDERAAAFAVTSTSLKVYDNGSAELNGESVFIPFGNNYAGMLSGLPDVTVTPVGSPAQLYIKSIEANGFTVAVAAGSAKVRFSWIAVGNRVDSGSVAPLSQEIRDNDFDNRLKDFLVDDSDLKATGKGMWWDGSKLRFDKAPEPVKAVKTEIRPDQK